jgi:hypothetical protein
MSPNVKWHCGNHIPVDVVDNLIDRHDYTIAFGCRKWKKIKQADFGSPLPSKWQCGHKNPTHIANNKDEKLALTKANQCKNWHVAPNS